jgi:hypothetical protein
MPRPQSEVALLPYSPDNLGIRACDHFSGVRLRVVSIGQWLCISYICKLVCRSTTCDCKSIATNVLTGHVLSSAYSTERRSIPLPQSGGVVEGLTARNWSMY